MCQICEHLKNKKKFLAYLEGRPMTVIEELKKAVRLVLALHRTKPENEVPGYTVNLDPMAKRQLEQALARAEADE